MRSLIITTVILAAPLAFAAPPAPPTAEAAAKAKTTFMTTCSPCHGPKGHGDGPAAAALNPKPRNFTTDTMKNGDKVEDVFKSISEGLKGTPMVAFAHIPENDRWALAYYVLQLRSAGAPAAPPADAGTATKKK